MTTPTQSSTVEQNKEIVRRIFEEIFNQGRLEVADELLTPDTEVHVPFADPGSGPTALKKIVAGLRQGFPDIHLMIDDLVGEGDKVAVAWHSTRQTHLGPYRGLPPTGRSIEVSGIDILRFRDGRVSEFSMHLDELGAVRQMGVVPPEGVSSGHRAAFVLGSLFRFAFLEARHKIGSRRNSKGRSS
jgi:ketosteroid isomerase-like protein